MNRNQPTKDIDRRAKQALALWGVFIAVNVVINGTVPFIIGADLRGWTSSPIKDVTFNLVIYSGLFLVAPLVLTKGWGTVRQPAFLLPLLVAALAMTLRTFVRPVAALAVVMLAYLHRRFNLSELGLRSRSWRGDIFAILLIGLLTLVPRLMQTRPMSFAPVQALLAGLDRLFANPATTTEYLFYLGFVAERLAPRTGRWLTPVLIGLMYTAHEMTNPEYWYEGMSFGLTFIGVVLIAAIYLWRRNVVAIWLGDGIGRLVSRLF